MAVARVKPEKLYYSIGEVSAMLNVNASLIRFWEKEFTVIRPKKSRKGNRLFTQKDIDILKRIYELVKIQGHTLEGAKKIIKDKGAVQSEREMLVGTLLKVKGFLLELEREL